MFIVTEYAALNAVCRLSCICNQSRISYAFLTWVAMWGRFFRQRANTGITRSSMHGMHGYVKKNFLICAITAEIQIWCAGKS